VTDDRIRASAVLFVEAARQNLFPLCQTVDGGLVGKKNFFAGAEVERAAEESGFADAGEIQEQNARIQVVDPEEAAAVVVARPAAPRAPIPLRVPPAYGSSCLPPDANSDWR